MTTPQQPSPSHQHDAIRSHMEIHEAHRASLCRMIGNAKAMADSYIADSVTNPDKKEVYESEARRQMDRLRRLEQRLSLLLAEVHSPMGQEGQPGIEQPAKREQRKAWQRPEWWDQMAILHSGIAKLFEVANNFRQIIGDQAWSAILAAHDFAAYAIGLRPTEADAIASMDASRLIFVTDLADLIAPTPWHLVDVDPQQGAQLVLLARQLAQGIPHDEPSATSLRLECDQMFESLDAAMVGHPEHKRILAAKESVVRGLTMPAAGELMGVTPPDNLAFEVNRLAMLLSRLSVKSDPQ